MGTLGTRGAMGATASTARRALTAPGMTRTMLGVGMGTAFPCRGWIATEFRPMLLPFRGARRSTTMLDVSLPCRGSAGATRCERQGGKVEGPEEPRTEWGSVVF